MLNLLKKIFPSKQQKALSARDVSGRNCVGYPTMQLSRVIDSVVQNNYRVLKPIIHLYKETLFFKWGPSVINNHLSDEQLANLSGRNLQMVYLVLFRDMLRHLSTSITPPNSSANWADQFAQDVLDKCNMLGDEDDRDSEQKQHLFSDMERYALDVSIEDAMKECHLIPLWTQPLAHLVMLPPITIYQCHKPLMDTILKKITKKRK